MRGGGSMCEGGGAPGTGGLRGAAEAVCVLHCQHAHAVLRELAGKVRVHEAVGADTVGQYHDGHAVDGRDGTRGLRRVLLSPRRQEDDERDGPANGAAPPAAADRRCCRGA